MLKMNYRIYYFLFAMLFFSACALRSDNSQLSLADKLMEEGNYMEAVKAYSQVIGEDPKAKMAYSGRGICQWNMGEYNSALSDLAMAIDLGKANKYNDRNDLPEFRGKDYYFLGITYYDLKNYPKAREAFSRAIDEGFEVSNSYNQRANSWSAEQNLPNAIMDWGEALKVDPDNLYALQNRAYHCSVAGDYRTAEKDFARALELDPTATNTWFKRGYMYLEREMYQNAIKDFEKALEIDPDNLEARTFRAVCLSDIGALDLAVIELDKVLGKIPDNGKVNYYMGHALILLNRIAEGCVHLSKAIQNGAVEAAAEQDIYCK